MQVNITCKRGEGGVAVTLASASRNAQIFIDFLPKTSKIYRKEASSKLVSQVGSQVVGQPARKRASGITELVMAANKPPSEGENWKWAAASLCNSPACK